MQIMRSNHCRMLVASRKTTARSGFSLGRLHMEGICLPPPPPYGGQVKGNKALMGGLMRGDIDLMEGDLTSIDYIIN